MPGFNQTGPSGQGPMTGKGSGLCRAGRPAYETGFTNTLGQGRGVRFGWGFRCGPGQQTRGRPRRRLGQARWASGNISVEDGSLETDRLKREADAMKSALEALNQQLSELEKRE